MAAIIYATLIIGVFCIVAFLMINYVLVKNRLNIGLWGFFPFIMLFLMVGQYYLLLKNNIPTANLFTLVTLILIFFVALIKFWDVMGLTQRGY
jgi:hypothetical protein